MRVCILTLTKRVENDARSIAFRRAYEQLGYEVITVSYTRDREAYPKGPGYVLIRLRTPNSFLRNRLTRWLAGVEYLISCFIAAYESNADIYQAEHPLLVLIAYFAARLRVVRRTVVYDIRELYPFLRKVSALRFVIDCLFEAVMVRLADRIVLVDDLRLLVYQSMFKMPNKIVVIPNCFVSSQETHRGFYRAEGCTSNCSGDLRLIYSGAIMKGRCLTELISAVSMVEGCVLTILGPVNDERYAAELHMLEERLGVGSKIRWLAPLPPELLPLELCKHDIGVCFVDGGSLNNYFAAPSKFFDYVAAGLAVLASRYPSLERWISEYQCGVCCDSSDINSIRNVLETYIRNRTLLSAHKNHAARVANEWCWDGVFATGVRRILE